MTKTYNFRWEPGKPLKILNTRQYIPAIEGLYFQWLTRFLQFFVMSKKKLNKKCALMNSFDLSDW